MSHIRSFLLAGLVVVPITALASTAARAESWRVTNHARFGAGFDASGDHRINSYRRHEVGRAHGNDRRMVIRNHRPLFGFGGRERHRTGRH